MRRLGKTQLAYLEQISAGNGTVPVHYIKQRSADALTSLGLIRQIRRQSDPWSDSYDYSAYEVTQEGASILVKYQRGDLKTLPVPNRNSRKLVQHREVSVENPKISVRVTKVVTAHTRDQHDLGNPTLEYTLGCANGMVLEIKMRDGPVTRLVLSVDTEQEGNVLITRINAHPTLLKTDTTKIFTVVGDEAKP